MACHDFSVFCLVPFTAVKMVWNKEKKAAETRPMHSLLCSGIYSSHSLLNAKVMETKFKDQLMEFIEQEETVEMPFPSTLNANERRIIHEASLNYHSYASL